MAMGGIILYPGLILAIYFIIFYYINIKYPVGEDTFMNNLALLIVMSIIFFGALSILNLFILPPQGSAELETEANILVSATFGTILGGLFPIIIHLRKYNRIIKQKSVELKPN